MDWAKEMVSRLSQAVNGEKDRIIAEYQALTGKSPATLYRIARKHGFSSGRRKRRDAGTCGVTDEQLLFVSTVIQETGRENKGSITPVSVAHEIALDNGVLRPGQISEERLTALLREREMNKAAIDAETPSIRMRSLHPNHVHVFDASVCIQYYLKKGKGLGFMDERDYHEKKPKNFLKLAKEPRLLRMVLADHFSHYLFVKYYLANGESSRITFDFLCSAWRGGWHVKAPFRGVPFFLLMDAGAANVAKGILNFFKALDIEIPKNMPHNPRRQGSAETAQNIIETHFESRLRLEPATTVEELNEWVTDWLIRYNGTRRHRRHGMTRTDCWLKHIGSNIRDLPGVDVLQDAMAEPVVQRTVAQDNTISFKSETYRLKHIEGIRPRLVVDVVKRPMRWPEVVVVFNETEYLVSPIGKLEGGFRADAQVIGEGYKAQPDTVPMKVRKANENYAFGDERKKGDLPFGGTLRIHGHHSDTVGAVPMPRRGTPMEVGRDLAAREVPIMELFKRLRDAGVTVTKGLNGELRERFGGSISAGDADRVVAALADGRDYRDELPEAATG